jgi:glycosyltransferase involved in cell wall biosynthesis
MTPVELSNTMPCITIGLTCYNAAQTIGRALDSIQSQDWPNIEILIVDDASSDKSFDILFNRSKHDPRIKIIKHPINLGCAAARNSIIKSAKGEFLAFFDDDDVSDSSRLRLQYECITQYEKKVGPQYVACYASGSRIYSNGYVMPFNAVGTGGSVPVGLQMADYLLFFKRLPGISYGGTPTCSLMARTSVFNNLGGFDVEMQRQEDVDFAVRLSFQGGHFIGVSESVITQYATGGSEKSALIELKSSLYLLTKNISYLQSKDSYWYMQLWVRMRYCHFGKKNVRALLFLLVLVLIYPQRTIRHFLKSATNRFRHEKLMKASFK